MSPAKEVNVDWKVRSEKDPACLVLLMAAILHQLIKSSSHYLQGFIHPRWCRISEPSTIVSRLPNLHDRKGEDIHHPNETSRCAPT